MKFWREKTRSHFRKVLNPWVGGVRCYGYLPLYINHPIHQSVASGLGTFPFYGGITIGAGRQILLVKFILNTFDTNEYDLEYL